MWTKSTEKCGNMKYVRNCVENVKKCDIVWKLINSAESHLPHLILASARSRPEIRFDPGSGWFCSDPVRSGFKGNFSRITGSFIKNWKSRYLDKTWTTCMLSWSVLLFLANTALGPVVPFRDQLCLLGTSCAFSGPVVYFQDQLCSFSDHMTFEIK